MDEVINYLASNQYPLGKKWMDFQVSRLTKKAKTFTLSINIFKSTGNIDVIANVLKSEVFLQEGN